MLRPDKSRQRQSACGEGNRLAEIFPSHTLSAIRTLLHSIAFTRTPHVGRDHVAFSMVRFRSGTAGRDKTIYKTRTCPKRLEPSPQTSTTRRLWSVLRSSDGPSDAAPRSTCDRRTSTTPVGHRAAVGLRPMRIAGSSHADVLRRSEAHTIDEHRRPPWHIERRGRTAATAHHVADERINHATLNTTN